MTMGVSVPDVECITVLAETVIQPQNPFPFFL